MATTGLYLDCSGIKTLHLNSERYRLRIVNGMTVAQCCKLQVWKIGA